MAKRHKPEEIITKLRQIDVLRPQGSSVADDVRRMAVTEVTRLTLMAGLRRPEIRPGQEHERA